MSIRSVLFGMCCLICCVLHAQVKTKYAANVNIEQLKEKFYTMHCNQMKPNQYTTQCLEDAVQAGMTVVGSMTSRILENLMQIYLTHSNIHDKDAVSESMYEIELSHELFEAYIVSISKVAYNRFIGGNAAKMYANQTKIAHIKQRISFLEDLLYP